MNHKYSVLKGFLLMSSLFGIFVLAGPTQVFGQGGGRNLATRDTSSTERTMSGLENDSRKAKRDPQTIMAEVNEDFDHLRTINDEIKTITAASQLDYKKISDDAAEIKKRGVRLRSNLSALPKSDKTEKSFAPANEAEMRGLLASTHDLLTAFLSNPVFSDMGSLDNQLALKARRDLENVISMSDAIKSGADKLGKK